MDYPNIMAVAGKSFNLLVNHIKSDKDSSMTPILICPMCNAFKLGIIGDQETGAKFAFNGNCITIEHPSYLQGLYRYYNQSGRDQLHHLRAPILYFKGMELGHIENEFETDDLTFIRNRMIKGIKKFQITYRHKGGSIINDCLNDYILILSSNYTKAEYDEKTNELAKGTLFPTYNQFMKKWRNEDIKQIIGSFKYLDSKSDEHIKKTIADGIDMLVNAKDMEIDEIRST